MKISSFILFFLIGLMTLDPNIGFGASYPSKTVRVVSAEVGGAADVSARLIATRLSEVWGQSVVVDNRTNAIYGQEIVSQASPDGYTLLFGGSSFWVGQLFQKMPFDALKDFAPITMVSSSPVLIVVAPSLPVASVKDLIALAKAKPGELNFGTAANGTAGHLAAELLTSMAGIKMTRIQYKGAAPSMTGVLGGEVQMAFVSAPSGMPLVKSGKLKALAVTSPQPSATAPGVPTVASYGLPGFEVGSAIGIFAPAKTPKGIIDQVNRDVVRILVRPEVKEQFLNLGTDVVGNSPEQFATSMKSEVARLSKVVKDAGIRPE